jgi:peroxiredoxin Q/BCP
MASKRLKRAKAPSKKLAPKRSAVASSVRKPARASTKTNTSKKKAPVKRAAPRTTLRPSELRPESGGVSVGDRVPSFDLVDQDGRAFSSDALAGEPYVLYFYPKDDTPGCTKEACGFRDGIGKFRAKGVRVIGVSPDKPESHARFKGKYGLNFTLLSDVEKKLIQAMGVWVKKQNYGREYMGVERSTFLVGQDGKVRKVWRRVRVDGHVDDVFESA